MKITRGIVMIVASLLAGAAAVMLAANWMGKQANEKTTQLVIAAVDIELGTTLTDTMLKVAAWPSTALPPNTFKEAKPLAGRVVRAPLFRGEPILDSKLAPEGTQGGLPSMIRDGNRAISIKVNEVVGVAGFTLPGSFVDVMVNTIDHKEKSVSKIVLKRILVLAIAQEANRDDTKPRVVNAVTLEVTPEEAEKLDLARSIGTLSLILRNPLDHNQAGTSGIRREDLFNKEIATSTTQKTPVIPPPTAIHSPRRTGMNVEIIRGVQKANSDF